MFSVVYGLPFIENLANNIIIILFARQRLIKIIFIFDKGFTNFD